MAHANARLTEHGRRLLVERITAGWTITGAAAAAGISRQTGSKWWWRARIGSLADRSSAVHHQVRRHPPELVDWLCARRRELRVGPHILAWETGPARSSVYAILRREGVSRLDRLGPRPPVVRYERERPGELVHLDTKMLGRIGPGGGHRALGIAVKDKHRGIGWNRVHLAIDDHTRLASATASPGRTEPQTNGKAERLVRTLMREWAYATPYADTSARIADLTRFLDFYNHRRPHWSLAGQPPMSRVPVNNPMGRRISDRDDAGVCRNRDAAEGRKPQSDRCRRVSLALSAWPCLSAGDDARRDACLNRRACRHRRDRQVRQRGERSLRAGGGSIPSGTAQPATAKMALATGRRASPQPRRVGDSGSVLEHRFVGGSSESAVSTYRAPASSRPEPRTTRSSRKPGLKGPRSRTRKMSGSSTTISDRLRSALLTASRPATSTTARPRPGHGRRHRFHDAVANG
jgi:hypothetical protein